MKEGSMGGSEWLACILVGRRLFLLKRIKRKIAWNRIVTSTIICLATVIKDFKMNHYTRKRWFRLFGQFGGRIKVEPGTHYAA